jgi:hypothetical protein
MVDATHAQVEVAASPHACFERATAFESYPDWTSDVQTATVLARDEEGRGTQVELRVAGLGRRVRMVFAYDYREAPHAFSWSLVEGDMLRELDGRYAFTPSPGGTTVEYTLHVVPSVPLPGLLRRRASGMIMGNALRDLKSAVEAGEPVPGEGRVEHDMDADAATPEDANRSDVAPPPLAPVADVPAADVPAADVPVPQAPHPEAVAYEAAGTDERTLPPPSILESVIGELLGAVPEVRDHVLEAADALLDAAKALIDAADRVVRQQRGEE